MHAYRTNAASMWPAPTSCHAANDLKPKVGFQRNETKHCHESTAPMRQTKVGSVRSTQREYMFPFYRTDLV